MRTGRNSPNRVNETVDGEPVALKGARRVRARGVVETRPLRSGKVRPAPTPRGGWAETCVSNDVTRRPSTLFEKEAVDG